MTPSGKPWVGDVIRDEVADRQGVVSDVQRGGYGLRPMWGAGGWTAESVDDLTLVVPREEYLRHHIQPER